MPKTFLISGEYSRESEFGWVFLGYALEILQDDEEMSVAFLRSKSLDSLAVKLRKDNVSQSDSDRITTLKNSRANGDKIYEPVKIIDLIEFSKTYHRTREEL